jgi:hypothetical protein
MGDIVANRSATCGLLLGIDPIDRNRPSSAAGVDGTRATISGIAAATGPASVATTSSGTSSTSTPPRTTGTL